MAKTKKSTKKTLAEEYGRRLRIARLAAGMAIRTLARDAFAPNDDEELARAENNLSKYENGATKVPTTAIDAIGRVLNIDHNYIFTGSRINLPPNLREKIERLERDMSDQE